MKNFEQGIIEYETKSGKKRYEVNAYLGKDRLTRQSVKVRKKGFTTFKDAFEYRNEKILEFRSGNFTVSNQKHKLKELFPLWWSTYKKRGLSGNTMYNVKFQMENHVLKDLGELYVEELTIQDCQRAVNKWSDELPKSFNTTIMNAKRLINEAVKYGYINRNPMNFIEKPLKPRKGQFKDFYSPEEFEQFLNACKDFRNEMVYYVFLVLGYTGIRTGELRCLTWGDLDFKENEISITKTAGKNAKGKIKIGQPKTSHSVRTIPVRTKVMQELKEWKLKQAKMFLQLGVNTFNNPEQLVFSNSENKVMDPAIVRQWAKEICKKSGLRFIKIHGFRHTFASMLFSAGVPPKTASVLLGHANIKITMDVYTHVMQENNIDAIEKLDNFLNSSAVSGQH